MTDTEKLEIATAALKQISDIAVPPNEDPMRYVIQMQSIAELARQRMSVLGNLFPKEK